MLRITTVYIVALILFCASSRAWAHGIVGQRFFPEPVVTEDAFPADEGAIKFHRHNTAGEGISEQEWEIEVSKRLTPDLSLGLEAAHQSVEPRDPDASTVTGFTNPEMSLKYAMVRSPAHEAIVTAGLSLATAEVKERAGGAEYDAWIVPRLLFGKGLGDLPDAVRYLKPLALGGDLGFAVPATKWTPDGTQRAQTFTAKFYLEYSLPYLQTAVKDVGLGWPFNRLFPIMEVALATPANGPSAGKTGATIHPGFVWAGRYVELGVAADLPLNDTAETRGGVSALLHLFLDDLAPRVFRPIVQ